MSFDKMLYRSDDLSSSSGGGRGEMITRHNYEEYFILYLDNELSNDDRRQVEEFIQKSPDLKDELDILSQYKLVPDHSLVFENKEELMRQTISPFITISNYGEWLTLYVDDELTAREQKEVEQFAALHPGITMELALLKKTKLQPDNSIVFPAKETLYRRTEKAKLIAINWRRIAVAASLLLAIGLTAVLVRSKRYSAGGNELTKVSGNGEKTNRVTPVVPGKQETKKTNSPVLANTVQQAIAQRSKEIKRGVATKLNPVVTNNNQVDEAKKEETVVADATVNGTNNLPQPLHTLVPANDASNSAIAGANNPGKQVITAPVNDNTVTNPIAETYNNKRTTMNTATNPDPSFASLDEGGKNKKNRGFFRKAVRFFEKKTNINASDDDRLLVGGLAIKLK